MNGGKVVLLRPELQGSIGDCSVFLHPRAGQKVAYEIDGIAQNRESLLAAAALLEAVAASLKAAAREL